MEETLTPGPSPEGRGEKGEGEKRNLLQDLRVFEGFVQG